MTSFLHLLLILIKVSQQYKKFINSNRPKFSYTVSYRAVGRSENPGVSVLFGGHNLPIEIGLTDLPKYEGPGNAYPRKSTYNPFF